MPCRATQNRQVMVESSNKIWSTGEGNGKPLQHFCLENPINSTKRQKGLTPKDELSRPVRAQYAAGEEHRSNSRKNEETSKNNAKLWMPLVMEVKSDAVKNNTA